MLRNNIDTFYNLKNVNQKGGASLLLIFLFIIVIGGIVAYFLVIKPKMDEIINTENKDKDETKNDKGFIIECTGTGLPDAWGSVPGEYVNTGVEFDGLPKYMNKNNSYYLASNTSKDVFDLCLSEKNRDECKATLRTGYIKAEKNSKLPIEGKILNRIKNTPWICNVKHNK
jgi:hypothetical protein